MRLCLVILAVAAAASGCTHAQLRRSTIKQASTLADLQYQQVLDNLAMFACNAEALPWHAKLRSGTIQVTDLGSGTVGGIFATGDGASTGSASANGQRTVLGQWDVQPTTDADELELLHLAYKKAVWPNADGIDAEMRFQIWQLVATYEFAAGTTTILEIMQDAVRDRLTQLATEARSALPSRGAADVVDAELKAASGDLVSLIDSQHTFNLPRARNDRQLVGTVMYLNTPSDSVREKLLARGLIDGASPAEKTYAAGFDLRARGFVEHIRRAAHVLRQTPSGASTRVLNEIEYMDDERRLRCLVQYLNAVRADKINAANKYLSACDGKLVENEYFFADQQRFLQFILSRKYLIPAVKGNLQPRNPGLSDQAQAKVAKLKEPLAIDSPFLWPWFVAGPRKHVPRRAPYVGHYCGMGTDLYIWVMPQDVKKLREFTIIINALAPLERQDVFAGRGAAFSPGLK